MTKLGKTNQFPKGKLNDFDEGEIQLAIGIDGKNQVMIIDFGTPTKWIGLPKKEATEFAELILKRAKELKD